MQHMVRDGTSFAANAARELQLRVSGCVGRRQSKIPAPEASSSSAHSSPTSLAGPQAWWYFARLAPRSGSLLGKCGFCGEIGRTRLGLGFAGSAEGTGGFVLSIASGICARLPLGAARRLVAPMRAAAAPSCIAAPSRWPPLP